MKTNLFLLAIIIGGGWYLFYPSTPVPAPAPAAPEPVRRADYSGVRTFYSPLNDPPVSVTGHSNGYGTNSVGRNGAGQSLLSLGTGGQSGAASAPVAPRYVGTPTTGDGSTLDVKQRADEIARKARGE